MMEELIRLESVQISLIVMGWLLLLFVLWLILSAIGNAQVEPNAVEADLRQNDRDLANDPWTIRPGRFDMTPFWSSGGLPRVQQLPFREPIALLPDHFDDEDDAEVTQPFIKIDDLLREYLGIAESRPEQVVRSEPTSEEVAKLLAKYLEVSDSVDWPRPILLKDGIPVGYPSIGYDAMEMAELFGAELKEVYYAAFATTEVKMSDDLTADSRS